VYAPVVVPAAAVGTTYAVDEQVCLAGAQVGATVRAIEVDGVAGGGLALRVPPPEAAPVIAFPVDPRDGRAAVGARVPARDLLCLRVLLRGDRQGTLRAPEARVRVRYGPAGVFRRTFTVRPPTTLRVDRTGPDPRSAG
jgi:hypothetical protein